MKFHVAIFALLTTLIAVPATAEIKLKGSQLFGLETFSAKKCRTTLSMKQGCHPVGMAEKKHDPYQGNPIRIGGEARMGLVYDGEKINPKSKVSIRISFSTETDGGLIIGGGTTFESN